ncbi:MAG: hypothetical protein ACYDEF_16340 [Methanosarcina sp.]
MIEYAIRKTDGKQVQIGNCENIYGLRYEDRNKVIASPGCTSHTQTLNLHWRLPFPEEDHILPGEYRDRGRTRKSYPLQGYVLDGAETIPGEFQVSNHGLAINVTCYHGVKVPKGSPDLRPFFYGREPVFSLYGIKNTVTGIQALVCCNACVNLWTVEIKEILEYVTDPELKSRLEKYASENAGVPEKKFIRRSSGRHDKPIIQ